MMGTVNTFPFDETPTPTRFIRNCEEIGLFQDLQHNPFEETFRIATASSDISHLLKEPVPKTVTEETLNTPRVISSKCDTLPQIYITDVSMEDDDIMSSDFLEPILPGTHHLPSHDYDNRSDTSTDIEIIEEHLLDISSKQVKVNDTKSVPSVSTSTSSSINLKNVIFTIHDSESKNGVIEGFLYEPNATSSDTNSRTTNLNKEVAPKTVVMTKENRSMNSTVSAVSTNTNTIVKNVNLMAKTATSTAKTQNTVYKLQSGDYLPAVLSGKNVVILPSPTPKSVESAVKVAPKPTVSTRPAESIVKQKLKNLLKSNNNSSQNSNGSTSPEEQCDSQKETNSVSSVEDEKREHSRERNRMAQKRCRMKKKRWIMQLKSETECVLSKNNKLQAEVTSLRAEIAHLKTLLLAHRNCSVTRAMYKADLTAIMNNEVSEIAEDIEIPVNDDDNDEDEDCRRLQITYNQNQVNHQVQNNFNNVNFHVHVPLSPELAEKAISLIPDPKHIVNPVTLPRQINIFNSKFGSNKKLICDSKVVPIKPGDRSLNGCYQKAILPAKVNVLTARNVQDVTKKVVAEPGKKANLEISINGNCTPLPSLLPSADQQTSNEAFDPGSENAANHNTKSNPQITFNFT